MIVAAIDLGTVTSRLMIGEVTDGKIEILERCVVITNLGEGLASSGVISNAAYARLLGALLQFRETITDVKTRLFCEGRSHTDIRVKAVATSAMRDASNAEQVLSELSDLGFDIEVISGRREAELSFLGTLSGFAGLDGTVLTIDVGGGSTELILGTNQPRILASHSFNIGSRRVTELFLKSDPPSVSEMQEARAWINDQTSAFFAALPEVPLEVIAVAGTTTSALTIRDGIVEYDGSLVHGKRLNTEELSEVIATVAGLALEARKHVAGLHPDRAAVIIGGLITLEAMLIASKKNSFLVSDTDILQGILLDETAIC